MKTLTAFKRVTSPLIMSAILVGIMCSCGRSIPDLCAYDEEAPSLYEEYAQWFKVGTAMNSWDLREGSTQAEILAKQFNVFTLENESKPDTIHPAENVYNFTALDSLVEFANKYDKTVRGHTLVWHSQVPDWFFS